MSFAGLVTLAGMPAAAVPRIPPAVITAFTGDRAASRGLALVRAGGVHDLEWSAQTGRCTASITADGAVFDVAVQLHELPPDAVSHRFWPQEPGGLWRPVTSQCRCEVGEGCEHAAAALYALDALREQRQRENPPAEWRTVLRPLLRDGTEAESAPSVLGLRFEAEASAPGDVSGRTGRHPASRADLTSDAHLHLAMRPVRRSTTGRWVKAGVSWRSFEFRGGRGEFAPAHAEALTRVFAAASAERSFSGGAPERIWLSHANSPLVWQSLLHARDAGVAFLGEDPLTQVELASGAHVDLDLVRNGGVLELRTRYLIDGHDVPGARVLGSTGVLHVDAEGNAVLAALDEPVPPTLQRLLHHREPLRIDAADEADFLAVAYPRLRAAAAVTSSDRSVELPATPPADLLLTAEYADGDRLHLRWSWQYHDPPRVLPMQRSAAERRDLDHEDAVLATVRVLWPTAGDARGEHLTGVDTAAFTTGAMEALRELDHVQVRLSGTRHAYRELDGAPHVRIVQTPTPGKNDWFDLGFHITIDGREIPFPTLFLALAQGRSRILMPDRTWFSLENPAFDALRELIAEGEALAEWEPDHLAVSPQHLDLYEDLAAIADSIETSAAWERAVAGIRQLAGQEAAVRAQLPAGLHADLRPYQAEGFQWLALLQRYRLGGVLADDMGLGKTLQTLALVQHVREQADSTGTGPDGATADGSEAGAPFLIVAPTSVRDVWVQEAERFTPDLRVVVLDSSERTTGVPLERAVAGADLVVTSYAVLRMDQDALARRDWAGLVLDEAQFVKNRASRTHQAAAAIRAPFRLAITGTPMENSLDDLWSIFHLVTPGLFGTASAFRQRYTLPVATGDHPERLEALRRRIRPFLLRRTKMQVASDLPEKLEQQLTIPLSPEHRALYDAALQRERKKVLGLIESDFDRNRFIVFRSLTLLRMLALDPAIVDAEHAEVGSSKLDALFDRLPEVLADGHRVLLFSQFTSFLDRVGDRLETEGVHFARLDGSTRNRSAQVDAFRSGEVPVFLISLKAGGVGLTLTEADYVFLLDPWWNPATEEQAVDRAHRIGQQRSVSVYRMIAQDTIEEKVLALQQRKADLFQALTDDGQAFRSAMTANDIRELLAP